MKKKIETCIEVDASSEHIWEILSNAESYQAWNPFIQSIHGKIAEGKTIKVTLNPPGGRPFTFKPRVLNAGFPEIRWKGKLLVKGLFDGEHYFRLESISSRKTRFVHGENFSGLLVGMMDGMFEKTLAGFQLMNEALKKRAEQ